MILSRITIIGSKVIDDVNFFIEIKIKLCTQIFDHSSKWD